MNRDVVPSPTRVRAARIIAVAADFLQIVFFPLFLPGAASIADDVLDSVLAVVMFLLVGWHWAFLPTFAAKLVPLIDLVPTWTAAVFFATRKGKTGAAPPGVIETEVLSSQPRASLPGGGKPER